MSRFLRVFIAFAVVAAMSVGSASAADAPKMVLMDLVPSGVSNEVAQSLTSLLALEIERARLYTVFSMQNLRAMMKLEEQKQLLGVEDPPIETLAKIGKAVNAPYILHGTVGKVGKVLTISLDIVDVNQVKAVRRVTQTLVGDESSLVGSLRTAALALALDEKVGEDVSAKLIDDLKIAEKDKKIFLAFTPGWLFPVGPSYSSSEPLAHLMPSYLDLRIDIDIPVWKWIRVFVTTGFDLSVSERVAMQNKKTLLKYANNTDENPTHAMTDASTTDLSYQSFKVPVDFGVKFIPQTGRFLPYALLGVGFSWRQLKLDNEDLGFAYTATYGSGWTPPNPKCSAPYELKGESGGKNQSYTCGYNVSLRPNQDTMNMYGFDFVAGVGAEWLLTHNIGLKFEARYIMTYLFSGDLLASFWSEKQEYSPDGQQKPVQYGDAFPVWENQHAISASVGLIVYW